MGLSSSITRERSTSSSGVVLFEYHMRSAGRSGAHGVAGERKTPGSANRGGVRSRTTAMVRLDSRPTVLVQIRVMNGNDPNKRPK